MDKLLTAIEDFVISQPWPVLIACICLIAVFLVALIVMRRRQKAETTDWQEECKHLTSRLDALDAEKKEKSRLLEQEQAESARSKEDYAAQIQAKEDDYSARIKAMDQDFAARLQEQEETHSAQLKAMSDEFAARLQSREAELTAQLQEKEQELTTQIQAMDADYAALLDAKEAEIAGMQEQLDKWSRERDEIVADAHCTAEHILSEAAQRLAESEEEVRKNRLIAAGSLTDARRRISEMLLTAAGELCKGIPANSPIGYAPVYSIEDTDLSPLNESHDEETEDLIDE